ncbi:uncharacterized protein MELLADRAFT_73319 [Melampsora larici-populina 98AG31]|uniref:Uncharacterized protein n=1 Tax=Melampsora larici-populina (strain 98AG31 / pathotype 3-4-7) TaxID=747676 RepID=F4S6C1_MELLP|nr:uncharacterized protein MELLADRAFT_73319 [Melampsora larici-populina 98AG31]EGF99784.1 hypothetical protein MELLADRAFT_73319 [Melampsora larici-populina 98AG31]
MESNQNQDQTISIDSSSQSSTQSKSNQSSLPIHSESKPLIKTTTTPIILLRRHESSPNPSSSTQLKSSDLNFQNHQNHTLLINGRSIDIQITNPNLIFGSTTSHMITEEPQS